MFIERSMRDMLKKFLKQRYALIILVFYFLLLSYWMLFAFGRHGYSDYMYNLDPFSTITLYLQFEYFNFKTWVINLLGNIGVFIPFGILLPVAFKSKFLKTMLIFELGLLTLELLQLVTKRGSFDVDDLILNTFGFLIGYGIYLKLVK